MPIIDPARRNYTATNFVGVSTGGNRRAIFYDPHTSIFNNLPGLTGVFGDPGTGKTTFANYVLSSTTLQNKTVVAFDFKNDILRQKNLESDIGKVDLWTLGSNKSRGALDPFYLTPDRSKQLAYAMTFISILVGDLLDADTKVKVRNTIKDFLDEKDTAKTFVKVVERLTRHNVLKVRTVGEELQAKRELNMAGVCFSADTEKRPYRKFDGKTTIVTFYGMNLPKDQEEAKTTEEGKLASGILYLLTQFVNDQLFQSRDPRPKLLLIDEAWMLAQTEEGAKIIKNVALLGRSKGISCMLMTQYLEHFSNLDIESTMSTLCFFRTKSYSKAQKVVRALDLNAGEDEETIQGLKNGECLIRDIDDNVSTLQVVVMFDAWLKAYNTNPMIGAKEKLNE